MNGTRIRKKLAISTMPSLWLLAIACIGCSRTADEKPDLRVQLTDTRADVRYAAVKQLASEPSSQDSLAALRKALQDKDPAVRMAAAYGLGAAGTAAQPELPQLVVALKDPDKRVRSAAAYAIPALGPAGKQAVPALTVATHDIDAEVRTVAAQSLKKIAQAEKFRLEVPLSASPPAQQ